MKYLIGTIAAFAVIVFAGTVPFRVAAGDNLPPAIAAPGTVVRAEAYGLATGASAATNRAAIQNAIAASVTAGHRRVSITTPGTYDINSAGVNPYDAARTYSIDLVSGLNLWIGHGVTIRLANNTISGTTPHDLIVGSALTNVTIQGGGTLDANSVGQSGWTGGYGQTIGSVCMIWAGAGCRNLEFRDLTMTNAFGTIFDVGVGTAYGQNRIFKAENIVCQNFGEGFQLQCFDGVELNNIQCHDPNNVAGGDGFELSLCRSGKCKRITVTAGSPAAQGGGVGSAIDLWRCQDVEIDGAYTYYGAAGVSADSGPTEGGGAVLSPDELVIRNAFFRSNSRGTGTEGARNGVMKLFDCRFEGFTNWLQLANRTDTVWRQLELHRCSIRSSGAGLIDSRGRLVMRDVQFQGDSGALIFQSQSATEPFELDWYGGSIRIPDSGTNVHGIATTNNAKPRGRIENVGFYNENANWDSTASRRPLFYASGGTFENMVVKNCDFGRPSIVSFFPPCGMNVIHDANTTITASILGTGTLNQELMLTFSPGSGRQITHSANLALQGAANYTPTGAYQWVKLRHIAPGVWVEIERR